jgi:hypothetical protein
VVALVVVTLLTKPAMLVDFVPGLQALVLAAVVAFMAWVAFSGGLRTRSIPLIFPLALGITFLACLSLLYAIDPWLGFRQFASTFPLRPLFFLCMLMWLNSLHRIRLVMKAVFFCGVLFAAHGLLQAVAARTGIIIGAGDFGFLGRVMSTSINIASSVGVDSAEMGFTFPRVQSFFSEPAFYLCFLNACLFTGLSLGLVAKRRSERNAYRLGALLLIVVAPLTMSTAGVFSMLGGLALYGAMARSVPSVRATVRRLAVLGSAAGAVVAVIALRSPLGQMVYRYTVFERFSGTSGSASDRARGFNLATQIIPENLFGGVGYGNELEASLRTLGYASAQYSSHLISFIQMGIVGFLLHVGISVVVLGTFVRSIRHVRWRRGDPEGGELYLLVLGPFVGFLTLLAHGLLIPNAWWYVSWYIYVLAYALHRIVVSRSVDPPFVKLA